MKSYSIDLRTRAPEACDAGEPTVDGLWTFLGECLEAFTPEECASYFHPDGYTGQTLQAC